MRIAVLVDQFPSLSETFILNQITGLIDRGHEVDIYSDRLGNIQQTHAEIQQYSLLDRTYYTPVPGNAVLRIISAIFLFLRNFWTAPKLILRAINFVRYNRANYGEPASFLKPLHLIIPWLNQTPYDVILCHYGRNGLKATLLKDLGIIQGKIAVVFHGYDISRYLDMHGEDIYNYLFEQVDLLLPISQYWQKKLIALGCNPHKTIVHHMGIDCNKFNYAAPSFSKQFALLSVARLVEKKGLEYSIRAVAQLIPRYPHLQYQIVGDGVLRQELDNLIQQLNATHHIKLLGWKQQAEIISMMENSALVLAPSVTSRDGDCEGIPVCLMESMAKGVPALSTYHSGISELIEDGKSGYLLPERDVSGLASKIEILINDLELRTIISLAGRQKVEQEYNLELLNQSLEQILQHLKSDQA
ncbi:MAG: colanic acid biosynthesis glycosyltransferase WcaL [Hyellaceae cyanobacterium CSU_1_1]|nr:colanic acid biosynthesis glycosyltransferase WcaL [Hyellaceae cyanobacterium CSU_1_1]